MLLVTKKLYMLSVVFGLAFLSVGFTNWTFFWSTQHVPRQLKAASHTDASAAKLDWPVKTDDRLVLERYYEPTPRAADFLTAKENTGVSLRSFAVAPGFFRIISAPKVSRYISKSVLNI